MKQQILILAVIAVSAFILVIGAFKAGHKVGFIQGLSENIVKYGGDGINHLSESAKKKLSKKVEGLLLDQLHPQTPVPGEGQ